MLLVYSFFFTIHIYILNLSLQISSSPFSEAPKCKLQRCRRELPLRHGHHGHKRRRCRKANWGVLHVPVVRMDKSSLQDVVFWRLVFIYLFITYTLKSLTYKVCKMFFFFFFPGRSFLVICRNVNFSMIIIGFWCYSTWKKDGKRSAIPLR